jgi:predicted component of type VI protein secretion system
MEAAQKFRICLHKSIANLTFPRYGVPMKISTNPGAAGDAWQAWQAKLHAMPHLTPTEKQKATAVLIRLMKLRETRRSNAR